MNANFAEPAIRAEQMLKRAVAAAELGNMAMATAYAEDAIAALGDLRWVLNTMLLEAAAKAKQ